MYKTLFYSGLLITTLFVSLAAGHQLMPAASSFDDPTSSVPRKNVGYSTRSVGSPPDLFHLIKDSDLVVVARVQEVFRIGRTPLDAPPSLSGSRKHTVFNVLVEQFLMGSGQRTIKVYQPGGLMDGVLYIESGDPMLILGSRYILFLNNPSNRHSFTLGFRPHVIGGTTYNGGGNDEYVFKQPFVGKIALDSGFARPASDPNQRDLPVTWRFRHPDSEQVIGLPASEAIEAVRKAAGRVKEERERQGALL